MCIPAVMHVCRREWPRLQAKLLLGMLYLLLEWALALLLHTWCT